MHELRVIARRILNNLERERRSQVILVVCMALVCALALGEALVSSHRARRAWLTEMPVVIATDDIGKGDTITALNTELRSLPRAVIPDDAFTAIPHGSTARVSLRANTLLSDSLLVPASESVVVPTGWRVVALPDDVAVPELGPGDRVDIVVGASVVATDCIVRGVKPLSVAVPPQAVPAVATGARLADVSVVARP